MIPQSGRDGSPAAKEWLMDDEISFGRWVKVRRVALGLTQSQLAERTGYSIVTIRKLESGGIRPSGQLIDKLAEGLVVADEKRPDFDRYARGESIAEQHRLIPATITPHPGTPLQVPVGPATFHSSVSLPPFLTEELSAVVRPPVFVGRVRELDELATTLETATGGKGQILFVIGDAGRGKTTLVQEFARRAQQTDATLLVTGGHCNAHTGTGDPYLPFREVLATLVSDVEAKWNSGSLSTASARRLWDAMPITIPALVEHAPDLIGPVIPAKALQSHAVQFAPPHAAWVKRLAKLTDDDPRMNLEEKRLFAQCTAALKAIAAQRPLLLILEDLHWIDSASSSLLFHLSREIGDSPILLIGTYRPDELVRQRKEGQGEERHPLLNITKELKRQHGDIWLDLGDQPAIEGRHFVDAYLDTQPNRLGEAFRSAFFHRTGGHALFTVELLREMQERGDLHTDGEGYWIEGSIINWRSLPAKVEGVIEKRIDRLEDELQTMMTVASIEGEIFTAEVVARVQQRQERELVQRLSNELDRQHRLVTAEALNQVGRQRLSRYRFRHYLFQHYLYHRLDVTERAYLHEAVGDVLEGLFGDETEQVAVQLAYHYEQAGVLEKAVTYLLQAAERAQKLSAQQEAIQHLTHGLTLLALLPDTLQRVRQDLALQIALGNTLYAMKGAAHAETGQAFERAYVLSLQASETPQIFAALHGLHAFHRTRGESQRARAEAEELLHLAQNQPDPVLRVSAHYVLGETLFYMGEFASARDQAEQGNLFYHPQNHLSHVLLAGLDEGVYCRARLGVVLWLLGYPEQALQRVHEALTLAQALAHPLTLSMCLIYCNFLYLFLHERQVAQRYAEASISLAAEHDFALRLAVGSYYRGLALVRQGNQAGIAEMQRGLTGIQRAGSEHIVSHYLAGLAEGHANAGRADAGLGLVAEALAMSNKTSNCFWDAELYRLKGEMLLMHYQSEECAPLDLFAEIEACYQRAIEIARRQQAKSLELRAATSLSRLWLAEGKRTEAHALLAEIYGWFTEGFDTGDLIEARALLETLE